MTQHEPQSSGPTTAHPTAMTPDPRLEHLVLRTRIGIEAPAVALAPGVLDAAIAEAIATTVHHHGGRLDLLQIAAAVDPDWLTPYGPPNRAEPAESRGPTSPSD
jgi:hypothetical protein